MNDYNVNISSGSDIEDEDRGDEAINKPFDPSQIDVDIQVVNLGSLIDMLKYKEIDLQPEFRRNGNLWSLQQKSRLIESILLGLPLPSFYFSEDKKTKKLAIIDGLQRICALNDFILEEKNPLRLCGLQFLNQFEGKCYNDLDRPEIKRINSLKVVLNTLRKETPVNVKYVIISQRLNTAKILLTPQEIRHALNPGRPAKFIQELAESDVFRKATNGKIPTERMEDRGFVNRFIAFYLLGYTQEYEGELDNFMNKGMSLLDTKTDEELDRIKTAFYKSMQVISEIFGNDAFRKMSEGNTRRCPISKPIYDTLSVNISKLNDREQSKLIQHKEEFKNKFTDLLGDSDFNDAITTGTAKKPAVKYRFKRINELLKEITSHD